MIDINGKTISCNNDKSEYIDNFIKQRITLEDREYNNNIIDTKAMRTSYIYKEFYKKLMDIKIKRRSLALISAPCSIK